MKHDTWIRWTIGLGLVLALCMGLAHGAHQAQAQDGAVRGAAGLQDAVSTAFTYQGRVLHEGMSIDDTCDFEFSLWDASDGGTEHGMQPTYGVPVSDGFFSVELDFGSGAFGGDARYLQIGVDCGLGFALLHPRQALTATPYAHSLRPGASVASSTGTALNLSTAATSGAALNANASASSGNPAAVYGSSHAPGGSGVSGYNSSSGSGIHGSAGGSTGTPYGVYGVASHAGSATSYGVYGKSNSSVGTGVGGEAPMNGVYGKATSSNGYGVYGEATAASGTTYGVYGKASSTSGKGVYGEGPTGVHGYSPAGAGVWGSSADGWGVSGSSTSGLGVRGSSVNDHGVQGSSTNSTGVQGNSTSSTGVQGTAPVTGTSGVATASGGLAYGLYGKSTSLAGRGVHGEGGYYGVYAVGTDPNGVSYGVYGRTLSSSSGASGVRGHATAASGVTYGVHGTSDSPAGYGVYSSGRAHVQGNLTVSGDLTVSGNITSKTRTATLSVAPAAFWPQKHDMVYTNEGYYLSPDGPSLLDLWPFYAPIQLPQSARVTEITACFWSRRPLGTEGAYLRMGLERADLAGGSQTMAFGWNPVGESSEVHVCLSDDTIDIPVIDNRSGAYYLWISLYVEAKFYGMRVEYEYAAP